jgi:putative aldouronate transport system substrate-binding protein
MATHDESAPGWQPHSLRVRATYARRDFVRLAVASVASSLLLEACQQPGAPAEPARAPAAANSPAPTLAASATPATQQVVLPTYVPFSGAPPDYPGTPDGRTPPGYATYPRAPVKTVPQPFGQGGEVNAMMYTTQAPPTPMDSNAAWKQVNKEMGLSVTFPIVAAADYPTKLSTTIASGQIPELLSLGQGTGNTVASLPAFLSSACMDLTPFLAGDLASDYPNLAALPPYAWRNCVFSNRLYAVPTVRGSITGSILFGRGRLLSQAGSGTTFSNADDFFRVMRQVSSPGKQWGLGATATSVPVNGIPTILSYFLESFGVPNVWRESGGKLTKDWETEEFKSAVAFLRSLWDAGVINPNAPTATITQSSQDFYSGKSVLWGNSFTIGDVVWNRATASDPDADLHALAPFSHDGTTAPVHHLGPGAALITVVKKTTPERTKELLRVLNYLAAPFGSAEYLLIWYGVEGTNFRFDANGNPQVIDSGATDLFIPWPNLASPPAVLYSATSPDYPRVMAKDAAAIQALGIQNSTVGLYSATNARQGGTLAQSVADGLTSIIYGREPIDTFDGLVRDWRANGGDTIRAEFETALQTGRG